MDVLCFHQEEKYRSTISKGLKDLGIQHKCFSLLPLDEIKKICNEKKPFVILIEYQENYDEIFNTDYFVIPLIRAIDPKKERLEARGIDFMVVENVSERFKTAFMKILLKNRDKKILREFLNRENMRKNVIYGFGFSWGKIYIVDMGIKDVLYSILPEMSDKIDIFMAIREKPERFGNIRGKKIWVTDIVGRDRIKPHNLTILTDSIIRFLEETAGRIVIIDCIEYLLLYNDFINIMRNIELLNSYAMERNSIIIIIIDKNAYTTKEYSLLRRYAIGWKGV